MKKLLLILPIVALLAAGCGSSSQQAPPQTQQQQNQPAGQSSGSGSQGSSASGEVDLWTGVLQKSDNPKNGSLMLITSGHKVYLRTSRDYSSLIGQDVSVSYEGNMDSFVLKDITASQ